MHPLSRFLNIPSVMYHVRAFLKHLPKNISAICDDVSTGYLMFQIGAYMRHSNPEHSGGQDPSSNYR